MKSLDRMRVRRGGLPAGRVDMHFRPMSSTNQRRARRPPRGRPSANAPSELHAHVGARLKGWLTWDEEFFIGPRYVRLLEAIDAAGTISGACPGTGMSYRTCLNRIRRMERIAGEPMLTITRGGADHGTARLTPAARELVRIYRQWRHEIERASDRVARRLLKQ
jgi:molybdate transport system regulatory protein